MTKTFSPSAKQVSLYTSLRNEIIELGGSLEGLPEVSYADRLVYGAMSAFIDLAFNRKRETVRQARQAAATPVAEAEKAAIDHGFHQITIEGVTVILKVKHPKTGGRPYAYGIKAQWDEDFWGDDACEPGRWFYLGRKYNDLLGPDTLIDATDAAAFGHEHGWCLICSAQLDDPESVNDGIGPVCYKTITGETKAAARKAERLAPLPEAVKAEIKVRRAAQKANRDAEKRSLAEVA